MLFQCWPSVSDVGLTLKQHWEIVSCLLGDFYADDAFTPPSPEKTLPRYHDTLAQCWCHAGPPSATLGQHYSNQKPFKLLITNVIVIFFFWTLFKQATIWPSDLKRYIWLVHKDCFSKMYTVSHTQHSSFRKLGHKHYCNKLNRLLASGRA